MDMQFKNYETFRLIICQKNIKLQKECKFFDDELIGYNEGNYIEIYENRETEILFESKDNNSRLYMDGIETLSNDLINEDDKEEAYISPSSSYIKIYDKDNFPLIPGFFRVIIEFKNKKYFSVIKVNPKLLTEYELENIKDDLEKEVNGLAFELIKKNISVGNISVNNLPVSLYKFLTIKEMFPQIMCSLEELRIKPNFKVFKRYRKVLEEKIKSIDEITIKSYSEGSIEEGLLKECIIDINYNLIENQWVKKIIIEIESYLDEFIESSEIFLASKDKYIIQLSKYKNNENIINNEMKAMEFIKSLINLAKKMKKSITILNSSEWFSKVSLKKQIKISHVLFYDSRYNLIYSLYRKLKNNDFDIKIDNKFAFQWKRTDTLYEIWCFIKIVRILIGDKINFKINSGWLFDNDIKNRKILIPKLESGSSLVLSKDNIILRITYDESVPYKSSETSQNKMPVFITTSNNRPDGRIDVYFKERYIGSIILEFKYRDGKYLWNDNYINEQRNNTVIKQLTSYGDNFKSKYVLKKVNDEKFNKDLLPIRKVLIFYPKRTDKKQEILEIEDHNLKFIRFTYNQSMENVEESLKSALQELIDRANDYLNI